MSIKSLKVFIPAVFLLTGCVNLAPKLDVPIVENKVFESSKSDIKTTITDWRDYVSNENIKEIIEMSIANNYDIDIAKINIELAMANYNITKSDVKPKIDLSIGGSKGKSINNIENLSANIGFNSYEVDFFGKVKNKNKQALYLYESTIAESNLVSKTIVNKTLLILNSIASNNEMISKLESIAINSSESENIISKKVDFGIAKESDLSNAKTITLRALYDIEIAKNELFKNKTALNIISGGDIPDSKLPQSLSEMRDSVKLITVVADSSNMLSRPDIVMIEKKLSAANANIGVARANFYPSVKITTSSGIISNDFSSLSSSGSWLISPSIELPIFNSGLNKARLKVSNIERNKLVSEYKKTVENAFKEVADNINERESIINQMVVFSELLMESNNSFDLSEKAYNEGIADFLDILNLKRELYKTEKEFINLKSKEYENLINLYQSLSVY